MYNVFLVLLILYGFCKMCDNLIIGVADDKNREKLEVMKIINIILTKKSLTSPR